VYVSYSTLVKKIQDIKYFYESKKELQELKAVCVNSYGCTEGDKRLLFQHATRCKGFWFLTGIIGREIILLGSDMHIYFTSYLGD